MLACPRCRETYPDDLAECPADGSTLLPSDMLATVDPPLLPGSMVGEYRVERKLGAGTFGDVYAGEQPLIGKRVAVKLLHRKLSSDAEVVSRFVAEARAVNRIRHRNIIDIFSFGLLDESRHYFVMELLDGLTLGELLDREGRLSIEKALPIFRGIASGLDAAHEAGITHRDLKPDNVFLAVERDGSYFPKLLDFGIAKLLGEDVTHRTATGIAMGTPRYMSPEQCRGRKVDHRADIYSLGVLVHEALTGRPLFEAESAMDMLFLHMSEPPRRMSAVSPDLPAELDEPVLAMLAKRPKDRPASAGEAIAALVTRARAHGTAATLPASSASQRDTGPPSPDSRPREGEPLPADAATVMVRKRAPVTPVGADAEAPPEAATDRDPPSAGPGATEKAILATTGGTLLRESASAAISDPSGATLRSAGPASEGSPAARARGPGFWALIAVVGAAAIGGWFALSRSGSPADPAGTSEAHAEPDSAPLEAATVTPAPPAASAAPSSSGAETIVTPDPSPDPAASATATATATATAASTKAAPAPSAPGKAPPKPKYHDDLEPPPGANNEQR